MKMKKEMEKAIMAHIDALGSASAVYGWGSRIYARFEEDNIVYRFRICDEGNKYFVSHCGLGRGCFFTKEEEYEI
jgi:hypothetical protein